VSATFQAACNRTFWCCGCVSWYQLEGGEWVLRTWLCNRHETAAATGTGDAA